MSNAAFYFHADFLDLVGGAYVTAHPSLFTGEVHDDALGIQLAYTTSTPAFALTPPPSGAGNVHAYANVAVTMFDWSNGQRGDQLATGSVRLLAGANLGLQAGALLLTGLWASATETDFLSATANGLFQRAVLPGLSAALAQLPQPQLSAIMGLPVTLDAMYLRGGVVWLDASVGDGHGAMPGVDPGSPPPGSFPAALVCAVSGDVVGAIASGKLPITKRDKKEHEVIGTGYEVEAYVTATSVDVSVGGGTASGQVSCTAGVTGHTEVAGGKIPLPDISLDIGKTDVTIVLSSSGSQATVGVRLSSVLSVLPRGVPEAVGGVVGDMLGGIASALTTALNQSLSSLFTAFTLPPSISAFGIDAGVSFAWVGLDNNAMTAVVAVSPTAS